MLRLRERATGAWLGLAIGDALGMPTQSLPRETIRQRYGALVDGFAPGPPDHPIAAGRPAGSVTDDTEQAVLLAQLLLEGDGVVAEREWAERLLAWERDMQARGSLDLLGPSTRRALAALLEGADPAESGRTGDTNGAAMRILPVGMATTADDLDLLVDRVVAASRITHHTGLALAGAAAVAAAVSSALAGADETTATATAVRAAQRASRRGHWVAGADVGERIGWAVDLVDGQDVPTAVATIGSLVGTSLHAQESVPAAFAAVRAADGDPWLTCRIAASVGGDCDTIAAMAGAIAGALNGPDGFPDEIRAQVLAVNDLPLDRLVDGLLRLRGATP